MVKEQFSSMLRSVLTEGNKLYNPKGIISTIYKIDFDKVTYQRKNSKISLKFNDIIDALNSRTSNVITTSDLKKFNPGVFDSNHKGHNCNCTMLLYLIEKMGLTVNGICGKGVKGSPYYVNIASDKIDKFM